MSGEATVLRLLSATVESVTDAEDAGSKEDSLEREAVPKSRIQMQ